MYTLQYIFFGYLVAGAIYLLVIASFFPNQWKAIKESPYLLHERLTDRGIVTRLWQIKLVMYFSTYLGWIFILIGAISRLYEKGNNRNNKTD